MRISSRLKSNNDLIVYPPFARFGRKKLLFYISGSLLFIIGGILMIVPEKSQMIGQGWVILLFFGLCLGIFLIPLVWGPLLVLNKEKISIRTNPFLKRIKLSWQEIAIIALFKTNDYIYLGFALSPAYLETFLQRQPPFTRKILIRRLRRFHMIVLLPQRLCPCSLSTLWVSIQERYQSQIQQYHIALETNIVSEE